MISTLPFNHSMIAFDLDSYYYNGPFGTFYNNNTISFKIRYKYSLELYDKLCHVVNKYNRLPDIHIDFQHTKYTDKLIIYGLCNSKAYNEILLIIKSK